MSVVLSTTENAIRVLTLNRPDKRNALNEALIAALKQALRDAGSDESVRCIVIRGAGKDFCSGADLSALQKIATASYEENVEDARSLAELFLLIREVRTPVIAAVHGRALAGGCGLATACDLVVATASARFGYPEVKIGFVPAMVAAILQRNLGEKKSFELLTQGFEYAADEALKLGLVNQLLSEEDFEGGVLAYAAAAYTKVSRSAVEMTKRLLYSIDGKGIDAAMEQGVIANAKARMTKDCQDGIARFLEKS